MDKKKPRFLRRDWNKKSKLGRKRKNKQVWRKPKGRHNKLRQKFKGKSKQPSIGYGSDRIIRGAIGGLKKVVINNIHELLQFGNNRNVSIMIAKNVGALKRMDIIKKALEMNINIANVDSEKFIYDFNRQREEKKKEHKMRNEKKKEQEKKDSENPPEKEEEKKEAPREISVKTEGKIEQEKKEEEKREIDISKKEIHKHVREEPKPKKEQHVPLRRTALEK